MDAFDIKNRSLDSSLDTLNFYKGKIYRSGGIGDDRLQIRIVPHMTNIDDKELNNLPKFPPFEKGKVFQGFTEVEDGKDKASFVYVLCTPDFQYGYVMGLVNQFESIGVDKMSTSYNYNAITNFLAARGIKPSRFPYEDTVIEKSTQSDDGGIIIMYNFRTGDYLTLTTTGTILSVFQDEIYMRVGSPAEDGSTKVPFSDLKMTPSKIWLQSDTIQFKAKTVILGNSGHKVVGTAAVNPGTGHNGFNLTPMIKPGGGGIFC